MQRTIKPIITALCLLGTTSAFAAGQLTQEQINQQIQQVSSQALQLQQQMQALQKQLVQLQQAQQQLQPQSKSSKSTKSHQQKSTQQPAIHAGNSYAANQHTSTQSDAIIGRAKYPDAQTTPSGDAVVNEPVRPAKKQPKPFGYDNNTLPYPMSDGQAVPTKHKAKTDENEPHPGYLTLGDIGTTMVITTPLIHSRSSFSGSDLIVNYSSIGKDVDALKQRQKLKEYLIKNDLPVPKLPMLELSGEVEGQVYHINNFGSGTQSDIQLSTAELDMQALINKWFTAFMNFEYDDSAPGTGAPRTSNSNVFLDQGFLTFGNLEETPLYVTVGQVYVPFGQFDSYMISDSYDKILFRTKGRPIVLGYQSQKDHGTYASIYAFRGDTRTGDVNLATMTRKPNDHINQYGGKLGYIFYAGDLRSNLAVSYINNVADSNGMQTTLGRPGTFGGFGTNSATQVLVHRVPGVDAMAEFDYHDVSLISEYTTVTRSFSPFDLTFNGKGAKPAAGHVEGVYHFTCLTSQRLLQQVTTKHGNHSV